MSKKEPTIYDPHFWGLSTRPQAPPAPKTPTPPHGPGRPFSGAGYQQTPFGPFPPSPSSDHARSPVLRIVDPPHELKLSGEWRTICRHDLPDDLTWGRVVVGVAAVGGTYAATLDTQPMVEVRVIQLTGGIAEIVLEAAAGQRQERPPASSPGPVAMEWDTGEIPDAYEVQARARRGGYPDYLQETADEETLLVTVTGRFHR